MEKFCQILNDFAKKIGLKDLRIDPTGYCCLDIDNGTLIHLKYDKKRNNMIMISEIGELPDVNRAAVMRYLLRMNAIPEETKGYTLGYNNESGKASLGGLYPLRFMTAKTFEDKFKIFIDEVQRWNKILKEFLDGNVPKGEKSTPGGNKYPNKEDKDKDDKDKDDNKSSKNDKKSNKDEKKSKSEVRNEPVKIEEKENVSDTNNMSMHLLSVEEIDKYNQIDIIGRGSTSEVYKVQNEDGKTYAIKIFQPDLFETIDDTGKSSSGTCDMKNIQEFIKDYEILNRIRHPNIVQTFGICLGDETHSLSILLEYCPYDLKSEILKMEKPKMVASIYEIALAMKFVHSVGIIHRDLKPENILFDNLKHVKISDFGTAAIIDNDNLMLSRTQQCGAPEFMAPELINESTHYNEKIDVYSFGVLMYYILTGGRLPKITFMQVGLGKKAKIPNIINEFSRNLINDCWNFNPDERPSFADINARIEGNGFKLIDDIDIKDVFAMFK